MIDRTGFPPIGWLEEVEEDGERPFYKFEKESNNRTNLIRQGEGIMFHYYDFSPEQDASERYLKYKIFNSHRIQWNCEGYGEMIGGAKPDYKLNLDVTSYNPESDGNTNILYTGEFDETGTQVIQDTGVIISPFLSDEEGGNVYECCGPQYDQRLRGVCISSLDDHAQDINLVPYKAMNVAHGIVELDVKENESFVCCPTGNFKVSSSKPLKDICQGQVVDNFWGYTNEPDWESELANLFCLKIPSNTEVQLIINSEDEKFQERNYSQFLHFAQVS